MSSFDDYVDVDNSAVVCGTITNDDIIAQVTGGEGPQSERGPVVEADRTTNRKRRRRGPQLHNYWRQWVSRASFLASRRAKRMLSDTCTLWRTKPWPLAI
ncbi:hypothetical protein HPB50_023007 [Hyalomma asiaticum]|uniref:Uncharacterized protein n=1 Tax=Hyalomma asiaticum TaxID=266040 RepID=A0ACB7SXL3_HYAAI|nr:hypothetical protein HPB50_023007 [Hyalomma asiaticum]